MLTKQEGSASNLTLTYPNSYAGSVRPHAVTSTTGTQALTLTYDANGNLSTQGASNYAFDAENRLRVRDDASGGYSYDYDGNGALIERTVLGPAQTATVRPNAQGFYSQWNATPNVAHYQNVAEAVADDNGSYIEQAAPALNDTHLYPTASVPANALIDKVTFKARWEGTMIVGAFYPMYRQGGVDKVAQTGIASLATQGYVTSAFPYSINPVTGGSWTAAQVNSGTLEFGFRTGVQDYTPPSRTMSPSPLVGALPSPLRGEGLGVRCPVRRPLALTAPSVRRTGPPGLGPPRPSRGPLAPCGRGVPEWAG